VNDLHRGKTPFAHIVAQVALFFNGMGKQKTCFAGRLRDTLFNPNSFKDLDAVEMAQANFAWHASCPFVAQDVRKKSRLYDCRNYTRKKPNKKSKERVSFALFANCCCN